MPLKRFTDDQLQAMTPAPPKAPAAETGPPRLSVNHLATLEEGQLVHHPTYGTMPVLGLHGKNLVCGWEPVEGEPVVPVVLNPHELTFPEKANA